MNVPIDIFVEEVKFYELGDLVIEKLKLDEGFAGKDVEAEELPENKFNKCIWLLFEHPESSLAARVAAIISVAVIIISIAIFCLETLPQFKHYKVILNAKNETKIIEDDVPTITNPFFIIESICIVWFCIEFLLRTIACPSKLRFCKDIMNWIDIASIIPYFITLATVLAKMNQLEQQNQFRLSSTTLSSNSKMPTYAALSNAHAASFDNFREQKQAAGGGASLAILRVIRLVRVFRIFKLSRHSKGKV